MAYGKLSPKQAQIVQRYVKGCVVHDLGAGDLSLAAQLVELGAQFVAAVDEKSHHAKQPQQRVVFYQHSFLALDLLRCTPDVAFISWPTQYGIRGLSEIVSRAKRIIYLGINDSFVVCGDRELFKAFTQRKVLSYVEDRDNDLIVYGSHVKSRALIKHERQALKSLKPSTSSSLFKDMFRGLL